MHYLLIVWLYFLFLIKANEPHQGTEYTPECTLRLNLQVWLYLSLTILGVNYIPVTGNWSSWSLMSFLKWLEFGPQPSYYTSPNGQFMIRYSLGGPYCTWLHPSGRWMLPISLRQCKSIHITASIRCWCMVTVWKIFFFLIYLKCMCNMPVVKWLYLALLFWHSWVLIRWVDYPMILWTDWKTIYSAWLNL